MRPLLRYALAATALLTAAAVPMSRSEPLVIVLLLPGDTDALRGARFGGAEAAHAARLLGRRLEFRHISPGTAAAATALTNAHVVIGGATDADAAALAAAARRVVALNVGGTADSLRSCAPRLFHIAASDAMLRAVARAATPSDSVVVWHPALERYGAAQLNERYARAERRGMSGAAWAGWLAAKVAWEAVQRTGSTDPATIAAYLAGKRAVFDGHKGIALSFQPHGHQLRQPLYVMREGRLRAEVPAPARAAHTPAEVVLDSITGPVPTCSS